MNKTAIAVSLMLGAGLWANEAAAWGSANRFGGSTEHSWGQTSHDNRWGGSSEHVAGEGTEHTNAYGGNTAHAYGGGTEHTNAYGGQTYGAAGAGVAHTYPGGATAYRPPVPGYPAYPAYHPPVAVPVYSSGCYGCAAAAGAIVGVAAGAAVASANTAAASANAYSAGVAAGAAASAPAAYAMGVNYAVLPPDCTPATVGGVTYYLYGNTWFKPQFGANGVYYRVVPTP
jgi:hypothetical protein